jgi:cell division protein FtsL
MTAPARPLDVRPDPRLRVIIGPRRRPPAVRVWLVLAATVVGAFFLLISSRIALDDTAFLLEKVERQTAAEESRYWQLRLEAARLQSPERITEAAVEMGMVFPETVRTIEVPGLGGGGTDTDERWVDLKALLGAQP